VSPSPFPGAYPHQHHDPRGLIERIEAQLRERIGEAVEMAGFALMVDLRRLHGRPAPDTSSDADRREFKQIAVDLLGHVRDALRAELAAEDRDELERVEASRPEPHERLFTGQVFLARRLPDYWQRFEVHQAAFARMRLETPERRESWVGRLFGR
jgi:hypothetical protein